MVYSVISSELLILGTFMIIVEWIFQHSQIETLRENLSGLNMDLGKNV